MTSNQGYSNKEHRSALPNDKEYFLDLGLSAGRSFSAAARRSRFCGRGASPTKTTMSLNFLGKKSFHPSAPQNLRKLFHAEEKKAQEERRKEELQREHEQEATRRHAADLLRQATGSSPQKPEAPSSMSFMYQLPPGLKEAQEKRQRQQAMEKEKTKAEQDAEKFAILQNAPREGAHTLDLDVSHKPFGVLLKNVKCRRCGEWGHAAGDRECRLRGAATDNDAAAQAREDPMAGRVQAGEESSGARLRWEAKTQLEDRVHGGASASDANQQFVTDVDEDAMAAALTQAGASSGGGSRGGAAVGLGDLDPAVLAMLDEKQQRKLLKMYQKELERGGDGRDAQDGEDGGKKRKHHHHHKASREKHSKHKKHKKHRSHKSSRRDDSRSDGSASDSDAA